ncbi:uncharacterized protein TrAFT101_007693 [Trichoderma asperellum]|uniref:uncharacterized protein n=1 Tax=Trichoderma asperellum TaxID=101201 RepID=UPI00332B969B|nr:hypothetical protein TrAFT101_007693 [Trichoderma asperellum]
MAIVPGRSAYCKCYRAGGAPYSVKKALGCVLLSNSRVSTQAVGDEDVRKPVRGRIRPPLNGVGVPCTLFAFW